MACWPSFSCRSLYGMFSPFLCGMHDPITPRFFRQFVLKCLLRGDSWIFGPEAEYERRGDVNDVVFPCGYTKNPDGDTINIYYGAADCAIALARASVRSLLEWLDANGSSERRQRVQD